MTVLSNSILIIFAYLIGSLTFGNIISRLVFHKDITNVGSKSAGSTNIQRNFGWKAGICVMCFDTFKVFLVLWISYFLSIHVMFFQHINLMIIGLGGILGHAFPIYFKFHGGKCASVFYGIIAFYNPIFFLICAGIWWIIFLLTRYSSISSLISTIICTLIIVISIALNIHFLGNYFVYEYIKMPNNYNLSINLDITIAALVVINVLVIFLHRNNIYRLLNHEENKIEICKNKK